MLKWASKVPFENSHWAIWVPSRLALHIRTECFFYAHRIHIKEIGTKQGTGDSSFASRSCFLLRFCAKTNPKGWGAIERKKLKNLGYWAWSWLKDQWGQVSQAAKVFQFFDPELYTNIRLIKRGGLYNQPFFHCTQYSREYVLFLQINFKAGI